MNLSWQILAFVSLYVSITSSTPIGARWEQTRFNIKLCHSNKQMSVRKIRNNGMVVSDVVGRFRGWEVILNPFNRDQFMLGLEKDGKWYFVVNNNGILTLKQGEFPSDGTSSMDNRLFQFSTPSLTHTRALYHVASQQYVTVFRNLILKLSELAKAGAWCLVEAS